MLSFKISKDGKEKEDITYGSEQSFIMHIITEYTYGFIKGE